jgi:hypothetical protein
MLTSIEGFNGMDRSPSYNGLIMGQRGFICKFSVPEQTSLGEVTERMAVRTVQDYYQGGEGVLLHSTKNVIWSVILSSSTGRGFGC